MGGLGVSLQSFVGVHSNWVANSRQHVEIVVAVGVCVGTLQADASLALGLNTHEGFVTYAGVQHAFGDVPFKPLAEVLA